MASSPRSPVRPVPRAPQGASARTTTSLFVPCHRVVAAAGLGPYGSYGTGYKRRLLALEGHDAL